MNKPDRFERMVNKQRVLDECGWNSVWAKSAVKLLRREHASTERDLRKLPTYDPATTASSMQRIDHGQWVRLETVLAAIDKRRK